eukprot:11220586-Lingulodinium_polyedra.AAC.1
MLTKLSPARLISLSTQFDKLAERTANAFTVATACSGTDVLIHVLDVLMMQLGATLGFRIAVRHAF